MPEKYTAPHVLQLLSFLSHTQEKEFKRFLNSPYFTGGIQANLSTLFEAIKPFAARGSWQDWEQKAWKKWLPNQGFDQNYFRKACVKLGKFYYQFLAQDAFMKAENEQSLFLLSALNEMQAIDLFPAKFKEAQKALAKAPQDYENFRIGSQVASHAISHQHLQPKRQHNSMLDQAIFNFNQSYFIQRLKFAIEQIGQSQIISDQVKPDFQEIEAVLRVIEVHLEDQHDLVKAYYYLTMAYLNRQDVSYFQELKLLLKNSLQDVSGTELLDLYGGSVNYCIRKIRMGDATFEAAYEQLYEWMLEKNVLSVEEGVVGWHINNLVLYHINKGQPLKLEALIAWCEDHLVKAHKEKTVLYIQATLFYITGEFTQAQKAFVKFLSKKEDIFYSINGRILLARIYYEQEDFRVLESHISASMQYIRTQKLPKEQKKRRYDFFRLLRKLHQIPPAHPAKLNRLEKEIQAYGKSNNQHWLLQKLAHKRMLF